MKKINKIKRIAKKTLKNIKYLQTNGLEALQDENGSIIFIGQNKINEMIECWKNKPIKIKINGKTGIYYKNKKYILYKGE